MSVTFRDAAPGDATMLAELAARAFTETFGHLYRPVDLALFLERHTPTRWQALLNDEGTVVRLAEAEGKPVAYALIEPPHLPFEPAAGALEIGQFYVLTPWHGTGIADDLMRWALREARARGAANLYLSVFTANRRARHFYERHGFSIVGRHAFMVGTHADEDLIMHRNLTQARIDVIRASVLGEMPHGFLGRRGGVSTGTCSGLNVGLGSADDPEAIHANRRLAVEAVAPGVMLVTVHQIHSGDALPVTAPYADNVRPHADAMVTDRPGLALGILTADCTPILFADAAAGVIGAAHAGWKGALGGIIDATVAEMEKLGARRENIVAAVGPTIARKSYEVDEGFFRTFVARDPEHERFFSGGKPGHYQFDLEGFVVSRLAAAGVIRIEALGLDTYSNPDRFFSYRRATHAGEVDYGRQISLIALPS